MHVQQMCILYQMASYQTMQLMEHVKSDNVMVLVSGDWCRTVRKLHRRLLVYSTDPNGYSRSIYSALARVERPTVSSTVMVYVDTYHYIVHPTRHQLRLWADLGILTYVCQKQMRRLLSCTQSHPGPVL